MIPREIISKAIAGGWKDTHKSYCVITWQEIALDPAFWMALGKEMGWGWYCIDCGEKADSLSFYCSNCEHNVRLNVGWKQHAPIFYDLILRKASQEEISAYWASL